MWPLNYFRSTTSLELSPKGFAKMLTGNGDKETLARDGAYKQIVRACGRISSLDALPNPGAL